MMNGNATIKHDDIVNVVLYENYLQQMALLEKVISDVNMYCKQNNLSMNERKKLTELISKHSSLLITPLKIPNVHDSEGIVLHSDYDKLRAHYDQFANFARDYCGIQSADSLVAPLSAISGKQILLARLPKGKRSFSLLFLPLPDLIPILEEMNLADLMMLAQTGPRWYDLIKKNFVTKPNRLKFTLPRTTTLGEQITHWEIEFEFEDGQNLIWRICEEPVGGRRMKDLVIDNEIVPTRIQQYCKHSLPILFSVTAFGEKTSCNIVRWLEDLWNMQLTHMSIPLKSTEQATHPQVRDRVYNVENLFVYGYHLTNCWSVHNLIIGPRVHQGKSTRFEGLQFGNNVTLHYFEISHVFADSLVISKNTCSASQISDMILQRWNDFELLSFGISHLTAKNIDSLKRELKLEVFSKRLQRRFPIVRYKSDHHIRTSSDDELFWIPSETDLEQSQLHEKQIYVVRFRKVGFRHVAVIVGYHKAKEDEEDEEDKKDGEKEDEEDKEDGEDEEDEENEGDDEE